jgi:hypothetical protein
MFAQTQQNITGNMAKRQIRIVTMSPISESDVSYWSCLSLCCYVIEFKLDLWSCRNPVSFIQYRDAHRCDNESITFLNFI